MVNLHVTLIKLGRQTFDDVPAHYKKQVAEAMGIQYPPLPVITGYSITPDYSYLQAGESTHLTLIAHYDNGNEVFVEDAEWSVLEEGVVTVDQSGLVTGLATGEAIILADDTEAYVTVYAPEPTPEPEPEIEDEPEVEPEPQPEEETPETPEEETEEPIEEDPEAVEEE